MLETEQVFYKVFKQYSREYNKVPFPPCKLDTVTLKIKQKNPTTTNQTFLRRKWNSRNERENKETNCFQSTGYNFLKTQNLSIYIYISFFLHILLVPMDGPWNKIYILISRIPNLSCQQCNLWRALWLSCIPNTPVIAMENKMDNSPVIPLILFKNNYIVEVISLPVLVSYLFHSWIHDKCILCQNHRMEPLLQYLVKISCNI